MATKPNITYVLAHDDHDDDDSISKDSDDKTYDFMQWWRLEFDSGVNGSGAKVSKMRMPDYDVFRAVELEHGSALLVYGSDKVNTRPPEEEGTPLPAPLAEFVARDNHIFAEELDTERSRPPAYDFTMNDNDSGLGMGDTGRTSMDSTRVEGGGSDRGVPSPPGYDGHTEHFEAHPQFGLGPDVKSGFYDHRDEDDGEAVDIRLDDVSEEHEMGDREMETVRSSN